MGFAMAIDGPAGAGKSTIARLAGSKLGLIYIDTGAMFRAVAYYFHNNNIDVTSKEAVKSACDNINIDVTYSDGVQQIILNDENITAFLRKEEVGKMASKVAVLADVRTKLLNIQRALASSKRIVMDGRDIGTCVLPDADVKIYLTASSRVRAKRRFDELTSKGEKCDIDAIEKDIIDRDYQDMHREIAPLCQADDAIYLDTSDMTIDEVVEKLVAICREKDHE
jgi:cytidylate kinase